MALLIRRSVIKNVFDFNDIIKIKINKMKISPRSFKINNRYKVGLSFSMLGFYLFNNNNLSYCASNDDENNHNNSEKDDEITAVIKKYSPMISKLGFGGIMGFFAGAAVKRFGEEVAVYIGVAFIGLQTLQYFGYISVDYKKLEKDIEKKLDVTGDGKLDQADVIAVWKEVKKVLTYHLPSAGSFSLGLLLGVYYY